MNGLEGLAPIENMTSEELSRFCDIIPPLSDMKGLSEYKGPVEKLRDAEQVLFPISTLPRAPQRFAALISYGKVKNIMDDQKAFQEIFAKACSELRDSEFLKTALAILMLFYCYANFNEIPDDFEKAKVFDPMQILEFSNIKTFKSADAPVPGYTVCHWAFEQVLKALEREVNKQELEKEFAFLHKAAKLPFSDVTAPLNDMKELFMSLRREYREFPQDYCACDKCNPSSAPSATMVKMQKKMQKKLSDVGPGSAAREAAMAAKPP